MALTKIPGLILLPLLVMAGAHASTPNFKRSEAGGTKMDNYISDGFFAGGERSVTAARLKDIRRAMNPRGGYERVVLDLESMGEGAKDAIPYFQVQAAPNEDRFVVSIWADVDFDFEPGRIQKTFARSKNVRKVNIVPRVEDGLGIIELLMSPAKSGQKHKVEAFHLARPNRIILDIL